MNGPLSSSTYYYTNLLFKTLQPQPCTTAPRYKTLLIYCLILSIYATCVCKLLRTSDTFVVNLKLLIADSPI